MKKLFLYNMGLLKEKTQEQQADILGRYLPNDKLLVGKYLADNPLRRILLGLATVWLDQRDLINLVFDEWNPQTTSIFLEEWEDTLGIPDDCFDVADTTEERRKNILLKLTGINTTTAEQFEALATILGVTANVKSGFEESVIPQTIPFIILDDDEVGYTIVAELDSEPSPATIPQIIPFIIQENITTILECLFNKLKPANTQMIVKFLG